MMSWVRVLSLFLGYSLIGFGGDYPGTTAGVLTALHPPFRFD
jgi:hypothetical protein